MVRTCPACKAFLPVLVILLATTAAAAWALQAETPAGQLPTELRGAKIYHLPEETKPGAAMENPVVYKSLSFQDIDFEHLVLNLFLSVQPVDRAATVRRIYFQDIRANGVPVHIETFDEEFKLSKKDAVDLPAPVWARRLRL